MLHKRFIHIVLTRFNVKIAGGSSGDRDWLEHRFQFFERFCFPSVASQSCQNFRWLVFFSAALPRDLRARVQEYSRFSRFTPVYVPEYFNQESARRAVRPYIQGYEHLISTRLDNDDAIATRFIERVQSRFCGQELEFINFSHGFVISRSKVYAYSHPGTPFISLIERTENFRTVLCGMHASLHEQGPVQQIEETPGWLQVVHGRNLANGVKGVPVSTSDWASHFSIYPACLATDGHSQAPALAV